MGHGKGKMHSAGLKTGAQEMVPDLCVYSDPRRECLMAWPC